MVDTLICIRYAKKSENELIEIKTGKYENNNIG